MKHKGEIKWSTEPEDHDYPAAGAYLSLFYDEATAARYVKRLRQAPVSKFKAKDIFRASGLSLLGISNSHVEHDRKKILAGKSLSPLLLVRAPKQPKGHHCRWLSSNVCGLPIRRRCTDSLQDRLNILRSH